MLTVRILSGSWLSEAVMTVNNFQRFVKHVAVAAMAGFASKFAREKFTEEHAKVRAHGPDFVRQLAELVDDAIPQGPFLDGVLAERQGHHDDGDDGGRIGLGGGHPNLAAGIQMNAAVRAARDLAAHSVGHANAQGPLLLGI